MATTDGITNTLAYDKEVQTEKEDEVKPFILQETNHKDEAWEDDEDARCWWSKEEDSRVVRKLDIAIIPLLCICYVFAFLDRSNIGNAKTAGMNEALNLNDGQYKWLLTIFYISYICFQIGVLGYKIFPPSKWVGSSVLLWGFAAILQSAATNWSGMMAARFFIGCFEACFGTGVALYLSFFYPRREVGSRFAWFLIGSAIASAMAGSIAYLLQRAKTSVESWRLIFIVEAAPTILIGVLILLLLPDSIATARFLNPNERKIAEARLYRARIDVVSKRVEDVNGKYKIISFFKSKLDFSNAKSAFLDPLSYVNASLLFIINVSYSSIPVYLPTILQDIVSTSIRAQAFSSPPYLAAFIVAVTLLFISDRMDVRGCWIVVTTLLGSTGYLMLAIIEDNAARYASVWLVVISLFSTIALIYSWLISNNIGESKKGVALILFGVCGQVGPLLGVRLFPASQGPFYKKGMIISSAVLLMGTIISSITLIFLFYANKRKDRALQRQREQFEHSTEADQGTSSLQFQNDLNLANPLHRQEDHRRKQDIAQNREKSLYFRYSL